MKVVYIENVESVGEVKKKVIGKWKGVTMVDIRRVFSNKHLVTSLTKTMLSPKQKTKSVEMEILYNLAGGSSTNIGKILKAFGSKDDDHDILLVGIDEKSVSQLIANCGDVGLSNINYRVIDLLDDINNNKSLFFLKRDLFTIRDIFNIPDNVIDEPVLEKVIVGKIATFDT